MPTKPTAKRKPPIRTIEDVFSPEYCDKNGIGGCWLWLGRKSHSGYPVFGKARRRILVHRFVLENVRGVNLSGLNALHKCDVPACINPGHLFPGTQADNIADMCAKGRNRHALGASGVRGVHWDPLPRRWCVKRGRKNYGRFKDLDAAIAFNQQIGGL